METAAERYYNRHKLAVQLFQHRNPDKMREKNKAQYERRKANPEKYAQFLADKKEKNLLKMKFKQDHPVWFVEQQAQKQTMKLARREQLKELLIQHEEAKFTESQMLIERLKYIGKNLIYVDLY